MQGHVLPVREKDVPKGTQQHLPGRKFCYFIPYLALQRSSIALVSTGVSVGQLYDPLLQHFWFSRMGENDAEFLQFSAAQTSFWEFGRIYVSVLLLPGHFSPVLLVLPAVCLCDYFCSICSADSHLLKMLKSKHQSLSCRMLHYLQAEPRRAKNELFSLLSCLTLCIIIIIIIVICQLP